MNAVRDVASPTEVRRPYNVIQRACEGFLNDRDDIAFLQDLIDTPASTMRDIRAKAGVLNTFSGLDLRESEMARALAFSIAEDLVREHEPVPIMPLPIVTGEAEREIAEAYSEWLFMERRLLTAQLYPDFPGAENCGPVRTLAHDFHLPPNRPWYREPMPSSRAELVLRMVGALPAEDGRNAA